MVNWDEYLANTFGFSAFSIEEQTKRKNALELAIFSFIGGIGYNLIYGYLIYPEQNFISLLSLLFFVFAIAFYYFTQNFKVYKLILLSIFVVFGFIAQVSLGGFVDGSGVVLCSLLAALGALIFDEFKTAQIFFYLFVAVCILAGIWEYNYGQEEYRFSKEISIVFFIANFIFIGGICFFLIQSFYQKMNSFQSELKIEKEKSESLLLNILPQTISDELKETGKASVKKYEAATVIFADIIGFTQITKSLDPIDLIEQLNLYFSAFDDIMDKYGIEKIKTIGDAYLAVAGIPIENSTHAFDAVNAAKEMQEAIQSMANQGSLKIPFQLRIGIHTGALIAGVVGKKKFTYDIWGDAVNIAARMEQNGELGCINISDATFQIIKSDFKCRDRGKINAKNLGELSMYFVE